MCTLTFIPEKKNEFLLAMNRDESRDRPRACAPAVFNREGIHVVHPFEPSGGTWVATNSYGNSFALLNWYSVKSSIAPETARSRGFQVRDVSIARSPAECEEKLNAGMLEKTLPFRMVGFFLNQQDIVEWRWDGQKLENLEFGWEQNMWASSGFDEVGAQRKRRIALENLEHPQNATTTQFLRKFHSSHEPEPGPFSVCMHRDDAETVSYTEIETTGNKSELRYFPGPLCQSPTAMIKQIRLIQNPE